MTPEEISAVTGRIMSHRANLEADWAKVLLMDSQEQSPMTLSLDQLNCQVATKNIHWGFQPVPFWLRASGHLYLEPNQGVWLLGQTNSRKCSRKKNHCGMLLSKFVFWGFSSANLFFCRNYQLRECSTHSKVTLYWYSTLSSKKLWPIFFEFKAKNLTSRISGLLWTGLGAAEGLWWKWRGF